MYKVPYKDPKYSQEKEVNALKCPTETLCKK